MLIPLPNLVDTYQMDISGILHVGAHLGEEAEVYDKLGIKNVVWIEGNPDLIPKLRRKVGEFGHIVIEALVSDRQGVSDFMVTNNGESSSLLPLGTHKVTSPQVYVTHALRLETKTLDSIWDDNGLKDINFLNLDLQGAELLALEGMRGHLSDIDYVYSEVNNREVYLGCALVEQLDRRLASFRRVETLWCQDGGIDHGWGDALWIRS